jgi:hypothetical protein
MGMVRGVCRAGYRIFYSRKKLKEKNEIGESEFRGLLEEYLKENN